jgi:hypothetical protein
MLVVDPIVELHSTRLYRHLVDQDSEYAERVTKFVAGIAPILATTARHFPLYTRHDAHHGFRVTKRLGQILDEECFERQSDKSLGCTEILLLIGAACGHDLGMTVFPGEEDSLKAALSIDGPAWVTDVRLTDYLRAEHSRRGGNYIQNHAKDLGIPDNLISPLNWMMKSHNLSIAQLDADLKEPFAAEERVVDVRQLAAILCVGDAIEFSDTRVLDGVMELALKDGSAAAKISYRENRKHDCIRDGVALPTSTAHGGKTADSFNQISYLAIEKRQFL